MPPAPTAQVWGRQPGQANGAIKRGSAWCNCRRCGRPPASCLPAFPPACLSVVPLTRPTAPLPLGPAAMPPPAEEAAAAELLEEAAAAVAADEGSEAEEEDAQEAAAAAAEEEAAVEEEEEEEAPRDEF